MPNVKQPIVPPGGFAGFSQQTQATQALFSAALKKKTVRKKRTRKKAAKKRPAKRKTRRKKAGKRLVKGSAAAKRRMAQLRRMRKR